MAERTLDWRDELGRWLKPFLASPGTQDAGESFVRLTLPA